MALRKSIKKLKPPRPWRNAVLILMGMIVGLSLYLAHVANVTSYLTDDPKACVNCHVMTPQFITWNHSSHREVANCNDCHVPQDNVFKKYLFKAKDGLYHATIFTLRAEPQAIVMHEAGQEAVQGNCIRCHGDQVTDPKSMSWIASHEASRTERTCWDCHREIPHGRIRSLTSVGLRLEPLPVHEKEQSKTPAWMETKKETNNY